MVVSKIGYLIGVPKEIFDRGQLDGEHYAKMNQNKNARIIRNLCLIRNGIEQNYTKISAAFYHDIKNLHTLPQYIDQEAIRQLSQDGIQIIKANYPLDKYVMDINREIANRINNVKSLLPIWLKWNYVRSLFIMPNGTKPEGVKAAGNEYNAHGFYLCLCQGAGKVHRQASQSIPRPGGSAGCLAVGRDFRRAGQKASGGIQEHFLSPGGKSKEGGKEIP